MDNKDFKGYEDSNSNSDVNNDLNGVVNIDLSSNDGNDSNSNRETLGSEKPQPFYTESYKKPKGGRRVSLLQLALVAIICSILGGGLVFVAFQFVAPAIKPSMGSYFGNILSGKTTISETAEQKDNGIYKKIEIQSVESPITAIAEKVGPSVVGIRVTATMQDFFGERQGTGEGAGIIIKSDGYILTNNHVISEAFESNSSNTISSGSKIEVILPSNKDKPYIAQLIGRDSKTDIAVLKIDASGLSTAELGDSDALRPGELAVAIGNPGGLDYMGSVTAGIISGLNRKVVTDDGKQLTLLQTDAAINPGNSGGPLVNSKGQVIGINTIKIASQGFEGLGFAIPINNAKSIISDLIEFNYVKGRPKLGITIDPRFNEAYARQNGVPAGLLVSDVEPLSGAYKAGIKINDIITKFDGTTIKTFEGLETEKNKHKPGDTVKMEAYREGKTLTFDVTLTEAKN